VRWRKCVACRRRPWAPSRRRVTSGYDCPVCRGELPDHDSALTSELRLERAVLDWLRSAPVCQVHTIAGEVDPADPARRDKLSVLTTDRAVELLSDLASSGSQYSVCPDELRPLRLRMPEMYDWIAFVGKAGKMLDRHLDALVRTRYKYHGVWSDADPDIDNELGSVHRSPSGDVVVLWHGPTSIRADS